MIQQKDDQEMRRALVAEAEKAGIILAAHPIITIVLSLWNFEDHFIGPEVVEAKY